MKWDLGYLSRSLLPPGPQVSGWWGQHQNRCGSFSQGCSVHPIQPILRQARGQTGQVHSGNFQANLIPTHFQDENQARGAPESNQEPSGGLMRLPANGATCSQRSTEPDCLGESLLHLLTSLRSLASHLTLESARFSVIRKSLEHLTRNVIMQRKHPARI